jgi:hypothetical protein
MMRLQFWLQLRPVFSDLKASLCLYLQHFNKLYIAGGNAVGPYKDHFIIGQNEGKKLKFHKNGYIYVT